MRTCEEYRGAYRSLYPTMGEAVFRLTELASGRSFGVGVDGRFLGGFQTRPYAWARWTGWFSEASNRRAMIVGCTVTRQVRVLPLRGIFQKKKH